MLTEINHWAPFSTIFQSLLKWDILLCTNNRYYLKLPSIIYTEYQVRIYLGYNSNKHCSWHSTILAQQFSCSKIFLCWYISNSFVALDIS